MVVRFSAALAALATAVLATGCDDDNDEFVEGEIPGTTTALEFEVTTLVTNSTDPELINPWGIATSEGLFWIADNGTGNVSVFDANGTQSAEYPRGRFNLGAGITGVTALAPEGEAATEFLIDTDLTCSTNPLTPATFVFASMNGTLIAINDEAPTQGVVVVDRSREGASFFGVTTVDTPNGTMLLAADFANGRIDMFDTRFQLVTPTAGATAPFTDPDLPAGFSPWNVMHLDDRVFVAYAAQTPGAPTEEEHGAGLGHVTVFDTSGAVIGRLPNELMNAPWGMALLPTTVELPCTTGTSNNDTDDTNDNNHNCTSSIAAGTILVGNFGDGRITAFDPETFQPLGQLLGTDGAPLTLEGLWGITFAPNAPNPNSIFFNAGPAEETAGVFGRLDPVPVTVTTASTN